MGKKIYFEASLTSVDSLSRILLPYPLYLVSSLQELFQTVDRSGKGGISVESVEEIICQAMEKDKENDQEFLKQIFEVLKPVSEMACLCWMLYGCLSSHY